MKKFILKKISVLFIVSVLLIILCTHFFLFEFREIEDFGMTGIGALIFLALGIFGIILDYILSKVIEDRVVLNIVELTMLFLILITYL